MSMSMSMNRNSGLSEMNSVLLSSVLPEDQSVTSGSVDDVTSQQQPQVGIQLSEAPSVVSRELNFSFQLASIGVSFLFLAVLLLPLLMLMLILIL